MEYLGMHVIESPLCKEGEFFMYSGYITASHNTIVKLQEEVMSTAASEAIMDSPQETKVLDEIVEAATYIESMDRDQIMAMIPALIENVDFNYFKLGGSLARLAEEGWWKDMDYPSFRDCISEKFGLQYRKAMYLMGIYNNLVESEVPWEKLSVIGWTKIKEISDIVTVDNVDEWVAKIMGPPVMTVLQLQDAVKALKLGSLKSSDDIPVEEATVSQISFKVHTDQKENIEAAVAKAMGEAGTEFKGVALDAICMNYLSGGSAKPKALSDVFKAYQPEEVLESFAVVWPEIDVKATM